MQRARRLANRLRRSTVGAVELSGKVTVVTGAESGIGRAIARRCHAGGAQVVVADLDRDGTAAVADELRKLLEPGT